jgi:membrane-associated phospholipid phosphatase
MKKSLFLILLPFLLNFFVVLPGQAGEPFEPSDDDASFAHFPQKLLEDLPRLVHSDNVPIFLIGTIATAYEWGTDDRRNGLREDLRALDLRPVFDVVDFYGEGWVPGGAALGAWALGGLLEDGRLACFGRDLTGSLLTSWVLVAGVKVAVGRTRPDGSPYSFPSGHTITAFCVAPVVTKYLGWEVGVPAYLVAAATGLARVERSKHYLSDVLAGATLGILVGETVTRNEEALSITVGPGQARIAWAFN